jgi:hypothetical protein
VLLFWPRAILTTIACYDDLRDLSYARDSMTVHVKNLEQDPAGIVKEISSIYARWSAGEISQEDALFEIGDCLAVLAPDGVEAAEAEEPE